MPDAFVTSLTGNFESSLRMMEAALRDVPDALWETDLWPDAPTVPRADGGFNSSAPWFIAYHALTVLDYDLSGDFEPWRPPKPFDENVWSWPARVFTQRELLGYVDYCRGRVATTLAAFAPERMLPASHRAGGSSYGTLVGGLPVHTTEHAAQIRQFLTGQGVRVRPLPGDHGYRDDEA